MAQTCIFICLACLILSQFGLLEGGKLKISKPNISQDCEQDGICESVDNYPTQLVEELIKKLKNQSAIFNYDERPLPKLTSRINLDQDAVNLCETKLKFVPPKGAKDKYGKWRFIINDANEPIQVFRTEICRRQGPCSDNISFGPGYDGACIQNMMFREMFYVNEENHEIASDYFEVPVCCSCSLIRKDNDK